MAFDRLEVGRALRAGRDRRRARTCSSTSTSATTGSCARPATSAACPCAVWESGVFDLLPRCIDHATVGAAREDGRGAVLMRDVGEWLVPAGRHPDRAPTSTSGSSTTSRRCTPPSWGWRDTVGLVPVANRYSFFGPAAMACEAALGVPAAGARDRRRRLAPPRRRASPELAGALRPLREAPWPLFDALAETPSTLLHGDTKFANTRYRARRPHDPRRLVDHRRGAAARRARALPRAEPRPHSRG